MVQKRNQKIINGGIYLIGQPHYQPASGMAQDSKMQKYPNQRRTKGIRYMESGGCCLKIAAITW